MPKIDDMNVGSETGIETEEHYRSSVSDKIEVDKCNLNLEQTNTTKTEKTFLEKMVEKILNFMDGGFFKE